MPTDQEQRDQLKESADLNDRDSFFNSLDAIILCFWASFVLSILYFLAVQCMPAIMSWVAVIVGSLFILVLFICIIFYPTGHLIQKIFLLLVLGFLLLVIIVGVIRSQDSMNIYKIFL